MNNTNLDHPLNKLESEAAMRDSDSLSNLVMPERRRQSFSFGARSFLHIGMTLALTCLTALSAAGQEAAKPPVKRASGQAARTSAAGTNKPAAKKSEPDLAWLQEAVKNPELMNEINHLSERLIQELHYPALRTQSRVLARLPQSTAFYGALPNFGATLHQAVQIFHEELETSAPLRDFLQKKKLIDGEAKFEDGVQKFYDFSEYLGDEFLVVGSLRGQEPSFALIAEVKKPGVRAFLENLSQQWNSKPGDRLRIFDPQELAAAGNLPDQEPAVLVRPDLVVMGFGTAALRDLNSQLDQGGGVFAAMPLGRRISQSYQAGTHTVFGVDVQKLLTLIPASPPQTRMLLEKTGFGDAMYGFMDGRIRGKESENKMELVFNGPRHGVASWLAAPAELGSLDFVPAKSAVAEVFRLKNPAKIFDDIMEIAGPSAFAMLPQLESQLNVNLKQDILSKLTGEIGVEFQAPPIAPGEGASGKPGAAGPDNFTVMLGVSDPAGLQRTVKQLLAQAPMPSGEREDHGVTFYTLTIAGAGGATREFNYFFLDNYLIVASTREAAEEAARVHRDGTSLARSGKFVGKQGKAPVASAVVFQNAGPFLSAMLKQAPMEISALVGKALAQTEMTTNVVYGYADETSLRMTTNNALGTNAGVGLVVAAIAIPNLLRSRMAANEAAAAATVRTVNTAEITYSVSYPSKGYAPTLAALGPGAGDCSEKNINAAHACLLDKVLGDPGCTAGKWCEKSGYRFSLRGVCLQTKCRGYVVTATPISENTGAKSFCSTIDSMVRSQAGPPLSAPLTAAECKAWAPLQ